MGKSSKMKKVLICPCNPQVQYALSTQHCPNCGRTRLYEQEVMASEITNNALRLLKKRVAMIIGILLLIFVATVAAYFLGASTGNVQIWTDEVGNQYMGIKKNGSLEGQGMCEYANGDCYKGEWKAGKKEGYGIYDWLSGQHYEGEWKAGQMEGYGIYEYTNGDRYEGNWKANAPSGQGVYYWKSGARYEGVWEDGERNGEGTYYDTDGNATTEVWSHDERIS